MDMLCMKQQERKQKDYLTKADICMSEKMKLIAIILKPLFLHSQLNGMIILSIIRKKVIKKNEINIFGYELFNQ